MPRADGTPLWQFPDTSTIESPNGLWQSIIIPELERKMESHMIASALGKTPATNNDGNDNPCNRAGSDKPKAAYPAGRRLRPNEQEAAGGNAPCSKSTGKPL